MKNFSRALREASKYWHLLVLATLSSMGVAFLWGGNIGALFPIIEVTLAGKPLQDWIEAEIGKSQTAIIDCRNTIEELKRQQITADRAKHALLEIEISKLDARQHTEAAAIAFSQKLKPYIDYYLPRSPFQTVQLIVALLFAATVVKHILLLANSYLISKVASHISRDIRLRIFRKALSMDRAGFTRYGSSGFSAHIAHTTETLANGITSVYGGAIREPLKLMSCLAGACFICWRLVIISLVIVPVVAILVVWLSRSIKNVCQSLIENALGLHHVMLEAFANIHTVQAYGMEHKEQERFEEATRQMLHFSLKTAFLNSFSRPITELMGVGMMSSTILVSAYLVLNNTTHCLGVQICDRPLTISAIMVFFGLLVGATDPVRKMSTVLEGINTGIVAADVLFPVLDCEPTIKDPLNPKPFKEPVHTIRLRDTWFAYYGDQWVLSDVNLDIRRGTRIAVVGPNGAGKSSLLNLVCRFYDPQQGSIQFNEVDLRDMTIANVRSRVGLVTQQTELFNESIRYNICYGSGNVTEDEILAATRMARAHDFIVNKLSKGYDTIVGQNGQRLSGGQRQRIALARAILRNPEILILDEATSQVDYESEVLIREALLEFSHDKIVIMVTHQKTLLEIADRVLEINEGQLTERCQTVAELRVA